MLTVLCLGLLVDSFFYLAGNLLQARENFKFYSGTDPHFSLFFYREGLEKVTEVLYPSQHEVSALLEVANTVSTIYDVIAERLTRMTVVGSVS